MDLQLKNASMQDQQTRKQYSKLQEKSPATGVHLRLKQAKGLPLV